LPPDLEKAAQEQGCAHKDEVSNRPRYEVADIFRLYGKDYRARHILTDSQKQVMFDIENCRTSALGYHLDVCDMCGFEEPSHNSCHNRHCPKCQGIASRKWLNKRLKDLLPVPYYHVVFTLPDKIFPVCLFNQQIIYDLLFEAASQALMLFGRDPRWLGAELGFFGILHTWGQTLCMHLHVHFVVIGGGIDANGEWVGLKYKDKFLFPVEALSMTFKRLFLEGLKKAFDALSFPGELEKLQEKKKFQGWLGELNSKEWVVFAKAPFAGPEEVLRYVGRYTHRVAISNQRILSIENGLISFSYKDYKDEGQWKEMTLPSDEFIKRFLFHVLPKGFHKIRHYGFLGNNKKNKLSEIWEYLVFEEELSLPNSDSQETAELEGRRCPACGMGAMVPVLVVSRFRRLIIDIARFKKMQQRMDSS